MSDQKTLSFSEFRARIGDSRGKEFWRSLEDLSRSEVFDEFMHQEFPQQALPLDKGVDRRSFVKLMGASVAMAGLAACRQPAEAIVPYVNMPENLIPGKPIFFATAMPLGGVAHGVLVESHLNRPTKIEGNPEHPTTIGASDLFMQASVLGLYDPDRSQVVRRLGDTATWGEFLGALQPVLNAAKTDGAGLRILTGTVTSPSLGAQLQGLLTQYPGMKWHQWEAVSRDNAREGSRIAFGRYVNTHYDFKKANVVVAIGSDFLDEGAGHLRYARDFMSRRKVRAGEAQSMNRLYAIESGISNTGSVADHRIGVKPSQIHEMAHALMTGQSSNPVLAAAIKDLQANRGAGVVIVGDEQPAIVHAYAHVINSRLGNIGTTVLVTDSIEVAPINQTESLKELVADMNSGAVKALIVLGGNPVFDAPADLKFQAAYDKVPFKVHQSLYYDETSHRSNWHIPDVHYLETWGDARAHDGTVSIIQPLIAPLYNGRSHYETLGALIGGLDQTPYQAVRSYWFSRGATEQSWRQWLHDGVVANSALPATAVSAALSIDVAPAAAQPGIELELRHDPTIYDGRFANNGWLQELPKPQSKVTWDNVVVVGPKTAEKIGYAVDEREKLVNAKETRFVDVTYRGVSLRLPIWVVPGHTEDVATLYFGYGREKGGRIANGIGFNTYPMRFSNALHGGPGAQIAMSETAPRIYKVACTQEHQSIDPKDVGERGIIRAASFEGYKENPKFAQDPHHGSDVAGHGSESMYPEWDYSKKHAWAMVIDTSICTGCNGCVIACQAENNIAIVGKDEVVRERELHWLRIDRYYRGDVENPEVFHQPVPCMQCENAPCEPVCPVEATSHSEDGLNDMTYNRCVGTRYCSNNCPYKVRRFNFFHYSDYDTPALKAMRNPDVTVRTRGVMEKCTYCVQRVNAAKIEAEKQNRRVRDGEVITACQQACPTEAIVFGDMNDPKSKVAQLKAQPTNYALLEELQTRPRTTYLATIRNPHPDLATAHKADSGHEAH
ncbi:MAG TPA: TAT-variant-translocated molybdopterin oxidoreductase [Thermoanaerobaculia bacterium]|nr:TAT-variant-translocated molybdopterin oxidoreductase [Thermoanaerobaculia bacterium]